MPMQQMLLGVSGATGLDVDDVFSVDYWDGNGTSKVIDNGIDLSTEGGLVWIKHRTVGYSHALFDTARGTLKTLEADTTAISTSQTNSLTAYTTEGYQLGSSGLVNSSGTPAHSYVGWTFRKAEKFFDIVEYTGDATDTTTLRTISHNLGCKPGMILIKDLEDNENWAVYHTATGKSKYLVFDTSAGADDDDNDLYWGDTEPTSSAFTVQSANRVNKDGDDYIAYLFADDQNIIKCGSFSGVAGTAVNIGWEPQWVIVKRIDGGDYWYILDDTRGLPSDNATADSVALVADDSAPESASLTEPRIYTTSTGFTVSTGTGLNPNPYLYIAIAKP